MKLFKKRNLMLFVIEKYMNYRYKPMKTQRFILHLRHMPLLKKSFSDTVLLLDRFDFDSDGNKPRTSKTNTQYKELSVQTKHYNYDDDSV